METYDIFMAIVLVGAAVLGAIKGFAWQLASIASIVVSYAVAYNYREPFSQNIQAEPPWNQFLAMLILYVGTSLVIWVTFRMVGGTIDRMKLKEFDRQIGALFGLGKGAILCTLITLFAVTLLGEQSRAAIVNSQSGRWIARLLDQSDAIMPDELHGVVQPYLNEFDEQLAPHPAPQAWPQPWLSQGASSASRSSSTGNSIPAVPDWRQASGSPPWQRGY